MYLKFEKVEIIRDFHLKIQCFMSFIVEGVDIELPYLYGNKTYFSAGQSSAKNF